MIHARLLQKGDGFNGILSDQVVLVMTKAEFKKLDAAVNEANEALQPAPKRRGRYKALVAALAEVEAW